MFCAVSLSIYITSLCSTSGKRSSHITRSKATILLIDYTSLSYNEVSCAALLTKVMLSFCDAMNHLLVYICLEHRIPSFSYFLPCSFHCSTLVLNIPAIEECIVQHSYCPTWHPNNNDDLIFYIVLLIHAAFG